MPSLPGRTTTKSRPPKTLTWQEYQEAVALLYKGLSGQGRVQKNLTIKDVDTGQRRQVDVLLTVKTKGHTLRIVIDAKYHSDKLDVKDVEQVIGLASAVMADKAAIVAANGWTAGAKAKAAKSRLDLRLLTTKNALALLLEWTQIWTARASALTALFGSPDDRLYHALIPLGRDGGGADVLIFRKFIAGYAYVTADLTTIAPSQASSRYGNFELMICTKDKSPWAAGLISDLAQYTLETPIHPGDTMDMPFPSGSTLSALLFIRPAIPEFRFWGRKYGILLCVGITDQELRYALQHDTMLLVKLLEQHHILPYTEFNRASIIQ